MSHCIDLLGKQFGMLTVIDRSANNKAGRAMWLCKCECGNETTVNGKDLRRGQQISCGCFRTKKFIDRTVTHGDSKSRLYGIWCGMKKRCENKNSRCYPDYGGRGITICEEWKAYEPFKTWALDNGYADNLSIDRIDVNCGYSPENCRWADAKMQTNNQTRNIKITIEGETKTAAQWAEIYGIRAGVVYARIRNGWEHADAVTKPVRRFR